MPKQLEPNPAELKAEDSEDTIELDLGAEQMLTLSRADAAIRSNSLPVPAATRSVSKTPDDEPGGWRAVTLYIVVASVLSGGLAFLATTPGQPVDVGSNPVVRPAATQMPAPAAVDGPPVRFTNPFDRTEVFEFPSRTSETEARHVVADLLLQRARDRQASWSKMTYQRRKTAAQIALRRPEYR